MTIPAHPTGCRCLTCELAVTMPRHLVDGSGNPARP